MGERLIDQLKTYALDWRTRAASKDVVDNAVETLELIVRYLETAKVDAEKHPDKVDYINALAVRDILEIANA